jgi:flagellar biogenesis protein FliO
MYNQIEDILLNISIVIATVWIVKRFWGSFFEEKQRPFQVLCKR